MPVLAPVTLLALAGAVHWQAPAGCPDQRAVEQRVTTLLGRTPDEHELRAVGVVHAGPPWRLELETTIGGRRQQRTLEADDCRAVAEAAALVLAVSVDPMGTAIASAVPLEREDDPVVPEASPVEVSRAAAASTVRGSPPAATRARARPQLSLRVGAGGESGAIPGGTGGGRLGLVLAAERGFLALEGSYWLDRLAALRPEPPRRGATVGLGTAAIHGGVRLGGPRVAVPLSIGLEAGGLRTRAVGLAGGRDLALPWVAGVVGAGLLWSLTQRLALWGAVEGVLPLARPRVRVGRSGGDDLVLHEPAAVGVRALAGISIKISGARDG